MMKEKIKRLTKKYLRKTYEKTNDLTMFNQEMRLMSSPIVLNSANAKVLRMKKEESDDDMLASDDEIQDR